MSNIITSINSDQNPGTLETETITSVVGYIPKLLKPLEVQWSQSQNLFEVTDTVIVSHGPTGIVTITFNGFVFRCNNCYRDSTLRYIYVKRKTLTSVGSTTFTLISEGSITTVTEPFETTNVIIVISPASPNWSCNFHHLPFH